jgi:hypothetical protein
MPLDYIHVLGRMWSLGSSLALVFYECVWVVFAVAGSTPLNIVTEDIES